MAKRKDPYRPKREMTPAQIANLCPGKKKHTFTKEECARGGIKSGESKRKNKDLRYALECLMEKEYPDKKTGKKVSGTDAMAVAIFRKALEGDVKAFHEIRDTLGQLTVRVETTETPLTGREQEIDDFLSKSNARRKRSQQKE